jgi:cobalt-zinc-cadmium efflux system outer membrane protein
VHTIRLTVGLAAAWLAVPAWAQPSPGSAPSALLATAIENNRDLRAVRQRIDEARGLLRQAGIRPAPTLEVSGTTGRPLGTVGEEQFGAGISQTMETAGKRSKRMQIAEKQLALAQAEYDERVRLLRFEVRARYAEYAADAERLQIVERLQQAYRSSLELMKARVDQGDAAAIERDLLLVELSRTEAQQTAIAGRILSARVDLARLAGLQNAQAVDPPVIGPLAGLRLELAEIRQKSLARRPDLRAAEIIRQQGEAQGLLSQAEGKADVTLSAGYARVYSRFDGQLGFTPAGLPTTLRDRDDVLTVGVSIPLFARNRNLGNIEAALAMTRAAQYHREFLERSIPLEVESAWARFTSARQAYQTLDQTVLRQAGRNLEVIRAAYQLGHLRLLDVLNEERRLLDTQMAAVDAKLEVRRGLADLEKASGGELQ